MVVVLAVLALGLPAFGANQTPPPIWIPVDRAASSQPISVASDGWTQVGDAAGSCDATRYRAATTGTAVLMLVSSGTACADTRSLALTLQDGRANLLATISATQTTSLSTNFYIALSYRFADAFSLSVQESRGAETSVLGTLVPALAPAATWLLGPPSWTADVSLTRLALDYTFGPWSGHAAVVTTSLFTLDEIGLRHAITPAWSVDLGIDRMVAGFANIDATRLAVNGRLGDVSMGLTYTRVTTTIVPGSDDLLAPLTFTQSVEVPGLSVTVPQWGWLLTLSGTGSAHLNLMLTAQRSDPNISATVSGDPFGVSLTYDIEF